MIYILYGSDSFSRAEALYAVKAELDEDGMLSANTTRLDARQATPRDVFAACDTLSMFGSRRLVILEGALGHAAGTSRSRQSKRKPAELAVERSPWWALVDYAARMPEQTVLVLEHGEGYRLAHAVGDGKAAEATKVLHDLLAKGRPAAVLLLTIENRYRRIAVAREMVDRGENGRDIAARLRIENPFALERLLDQVSRYPMPRVIWALDRIAQADFDVKQGILDQEELSLELLVHELAEPTPATQAA